MKDPMPTPMTMHLSASSVAAFKACPTRFRYAYVEGLRPDEDTDSQRMGTNWHKLHEVYREAARSAEANIVPPEVVHDFAFNAAIKHLNDVYTIVPENKDAYEWEIERQQLAMSFVGHCWYYKNDAVQTIATELGFKMPLYHPKTRLPLPLADVIRIGKIDWIVRWQGRVYIADYKSTSKSIDADSDFWNHLRLDTQISMYVMSGQELAAAGLLEGLMEGEEIAGAFYDVWHKPTTKPSVLTQAETIDFVTTKSYLGAVFEIEVVREWEQDATQPGDKKASTTKHAEVKVDGVSAEVTPGKKAWAIRETPGMYGARLLKDIYDRPTFYFARREIPRTAADIHRFRGQLYSIYQSMKTARDTGHWIENEHQCNATFTCAYAKVCWHGVDVTNGQTPPGYKRIFANLTVKGEDVEI